MKNYEEAFKNISKVSENSSYDDKDLIAIDLRTLRELVDKATHKKPNKNGCPNCNSRRIYWLDKMKNCCDCGQLLDWSKNE